MKVSRMRFAVFGVLSAFRFFVADAVDVSKGAALAAVEQVLGACRKGQQAEDGEDDCFHKSFFVFLPHSSQ